MAAAETSVEIGGMMVAISSNQRRRRSTIHGDDVSDG
jgi:hypothetical protein